MPKPNPCSSKAPATDARPVSAVQRLVSMSPSASVMMPASASARAGKRRRKPGTANVPSTLPPAHAASNRPIVVAATDAT